MNAFEGQFDFILKDKEPHTLVKEKEYSTQIEENLINSIINPFKFPHAKVEAKTNTATNNALDPITLLVQKFEHMNT